MSTLANQPRSWLTNTPGMGTGPIWAKHFADGVSPRVKSDHGGTGGTSPILTTVQFSGSKWVNPSLINAVDSCLGPQHVYIYIYTSI